MNIFRRIRAKRDLKKGQLARKDDVEFIVPGQEEDAGIAKLLGMTTGEVLDIKRRLATMPISVQVDMAMVGEPSTKMRPRQIPMEGGDETE